MGNWNDGTSSSLYTLQQQKVLTSIPHITATLSLLGSSLIIAIIWNDRQAKLKRVYHRLLLGMSIIDVVRSFNLALSSLVVPRDTPWVWNGRGTVATCEMSGYINQFQVSIPLYTSFLCLYYVLIMVFQVQESWVATRVEPFLHAISWMYPMILGVYGLVRGYFNPVDVSIGWCMIDDAPPNCSTSDTIECDRGGNPKVFTILSHVIPGIVAFTIILVSMGLILLQVKKTYGRFLTTTTHTNRRNAVGRYHESNAQDARKQQLVADTTVQAYLYIGTSFITYVWQVVTLLSSRSSSDPANRTFFFAFAVLNKIFLPLTGFWNALIYMRPRYVALRRKLSGARHQDLIRMILLPSKRFARGEQQSSRNHDPNDNDSENVFHNDEYPPPPPPHHHSDKVENGQIDERNGNESLHDQECPSEFRRTAVTSIGSSPSNKVIPEDKRPVQKVRWIDDYIPEISLQESLREGSSPLSSSSLSIQEGESRSTTGSPSVALDRSKRSVS